jgi:hypothetical protein
MAACASGAWWGGVVHQSEVAFLSTATGEELAWFPVALTRLTADPTGRVWAGTYGNRLYLFRREVQGW